MKNNNNKVELKHGQIFKTATGMTGVVVLMDGMWYLAGKNWGQIQDSYPSGREIQKYFNSRPGSEEYEYRVVELLEYPYHPIDFASLANTYANGPNLPSDLETVWAEGQEKTELTLKQVADKFGIPVEQLRIKDE